MSRLRNLWLYLTTRSGRTIAELERENEALCEQLCKKVNDSAFLTEFALNKNGLTFGLEGAAAQLLAEAFAQQFIEHKAVNYLECRFQSRHLMPKESLVVTIQKISGRTPHQLREEAERKLRALQHDQPEPTGSA